MNFLDYNPYNLSDNGASDLIVPKFAIIFESTYKFHNW